MDGEIMPGELAGLLGIDDGSVADTDGNDRADTIDAQPSHSLRVVDIRDARAFDRGRIPQSECVPFPELTTRITELAGADRIVTVCPHGIASRQAAQLIGSYTGTQDACVESLHGGIEAWQRDVGELERSPDASDQTGTEADSADEGPAAPF